MTLQSRWARYAYLFGSAIINEVLMTEFYSVHAPAGHKWVCVAIGLAQQVIACGMSWLNLIEAQSNKERMIRWAVTAAGYGAAAAIIVG